MRCQGNCRAASHSPMTRAVSCWRRLREEMSLPLHLVKCGLRQKRLRPGIGRGGKGIAVLGAYNQDRRQATQLGQVDPDILINRCKVICLPFRTPGQFESRTSSADAQTVLDVLFQRFGRPICENSLLAKAAVGILAAIEDLTPPPRALNQWEFFNLAGVAGRGQHVERFLRQQHGVQHDQSPEPHRLLDQCQQRQHAAQGMPESDDVAQAKTI